jgi:hypothetical protein
LGFIDWFKRTTFQGTIKRDLGSVELHGGLGKTRFNLQELEPKGVERRFRLSLVRTGFLSWQEVPLVLTAEQMTRLGALIQAGLSPETESGSDPIRPEW